MKIIRIKKKNFKFSRKQIKVLILFSVSIHKARMNLKLTIIKIKKNFNEVYSLFLSFVSSFLFSIHSAEGTKGNLTWNKFKI